MMDGRYYRMQHAGDALSRSWRSAIQDGSGDEPGTSACRSLGALLGYSRADMPRGEVEIIVFAGEEVAAGTDGEPVVEPAVELERWAHDAWTGIGRLDRFTQERIGDLADTKPGLTLSALGWRRVASMQVEP